MDGRGIKYLHKCGEEMSKNSSLPSREQQETSELNGSGGGRAKGIRGGQGLLSRLETPTGTKLGPFVPVGGSNREKRLRGPFVPVRTTNRDKRPPFYPGWCLQPGQKVPVPPTGPASHWIRDKSHLLFRAQMLPGQMAWNKDLFCSSVRRTHTKFKLTSKFF